MGYFKQKISKKNVCILIFALVLAFGLFILFRVIVIGLNNVDYNNYYGDIVISIPDADEKIIIREWNYFRTGGSRIYYLDSQGVEYHMGRTYSDEGYRPFDDGEYEIIFEESGINVSWIYSHDIIKDDYFEYPNPLENIAQNAEDNNIDPINYYEDIVIDIPDSDEKIIIKEWDSSYTGGSVIYYLDAQGVEHHMGGTYSYDGYRPFDDGKYEITFEENGITVSWIHTESRDYYSDDFFGYPAVSP